MESEAGSSVSDSIILEIEETKVYCNRTDLTENSDYFTVMFEGNFAEKDKNVITLKGVDPEALKIILKFLHSEEFAINEQNVLSVLETACMLQFLQVKKTCLDLVKKILRPDNCIRIWVLAERLDLKELCSKSKLLSLQEFMFIKDSEKQDFLELSLDLMLNYLGNVNLQCTKEFYVFEMLNTWYENSEEKNEDTLRKLLHCVNYRALTLDDIDNIIDSKYVSQFEVLTESLKCVKALKNGNDLFGFKDEHLELGKKLFGAKSRNSDWILPCISMGHTRKASKHVRTKRHRKAYRTLEEISDADYIVTYYDFTSRTLKKLLAFNIPTKRHMVGFEMIGYKNFVLIFEGSLTKGSHDFNYDFHIYDVTKKIWMKKEALYHIFEFEWCGCGNKVFIVGGYGPFKVPQLTLFWYNLDTGEFSELADFPCPTTNIKCCQFQNQLFLLDINDKRGYIFDSWSKTWTTLQIVDSDKVLPSYSKKITVFSYQDSIFIKEKNVHLLRVEEDKLVITDVVPLSHRKASCTSVLVGDRLYTLSKEHETMVLEVFNVSTKERSECLRSTEGVFEVDGEKFAFDSSSFNIFSVFNPNFVMENDVINSW